MGNLLFKNIAKVYPRNIIAVQDFNLEIEDKEFVVLVGPSGCGKSSLLRMVAGLEEITEGELFIDGVLINDIHPKDRDIAMVFQNYALYPHMNVYENMALGLELRKVPKPEIRKKISAVAKSLQIEELLERRPRALSGGQQQRVALGRAIVRNPKVFLMNEPLSNLDAKLRAEMRMEIIGLHQELKTTFIYVTHDQTEAMTMGTKIVAMKDGFIQQVAPPKELYDRPVNMFVASFIGSPQMNFIKVNGVKEKDQYSLVLGKSKINFSKKTAKTLEDSGYIEKELVLGIRPEHIRFSNEGDYMKLNSIVQLVELLGSETLLHLVVEDEKISMKISSGYNIKAGDKLSIFFDEEKVYLFDKKTEMTIFYGNR